MTVLWGCLGIVLPGCDSDRVTDCARGFGEEHHHGTYISLLLTGKLWKHLVGTNAACHERMDFLIPAMAKQEGVTETLKATDQIIRFAELRDF